MGCERTGTRDSNPQVVQTDEWKITYDKASQIVTIDPLPGPKEHRHHHQFVGDPHDIMDGVQQFDFPAPTCSFILTDGTLLICDAPTAGSTIHDCHIFTDDGQHFALGDATAFQGNVGWVFVQQDDGSFYSIVNKPITNHCVWDSNKQEWSGDRTPINFNFKES